MSFLLYNENHAIVASHSVCAKIQKESVFRRKTYGNKGDIASAGGYLFWLRGPQLIPSTFGLLLACLLRCPKKFFAHTQTFSTVATRSTSYVHRSYNPKRKKATDTLSITLSLKEPNGLDDTDFRK